MENQKNKTKQNEAKQYNYIRIVLSLKQNKQAKQNQTNKNKITISLKETLFKWLPIFQIVKMIKIVNA